MQCPTCVAQSPMCVSQHPKVMTQTLAKSILRNVQDAKMRNIPDVLRNVLDVLRNVQDVLRHNGLIFPIQRRRLAHLIVKLHFLTY